MRKISQVKVIYDAFKAQALGEMPKKKSDWPAWYKERMDICATCKYNTKNIPFKYLPVGMYISKSLGQHRCTVCTCFIDKKCWSRTEECGLGENEGRPDYIPAEFVKDESDESKWNRLDLITCDSDEFNLKSTDESLYNLDLSPDKTMFDILFTKDVKKGERLKFSFILESKSDVKVLDWQKTCGCLQPVVQNVAKGRYLVNMEVNTTNFPVGQVERRVRAIYEVPGGKMVKDENGEEHPETSQIEIRFIIPIVENDTPEKP